MFSYFLIIGLIIDENVAIKINIKRLILQFKRCSFVGKDQFNVTGFVDYVCKNLTRLTP
jgi:hypothetical protein